MITVIAKKQLYVTALCEALSEFDAQPFKEENGFGDALIIALDQERADEILSQDVSCPVLLIGSTHEEADIELKEPCVLYELKAYLTDLLNKKDMAPIFENKRFLFEGAKRRLFDKKIKKDYYLTEKETDLISFLVKVLPDGTTKTDLLTDVWKYRPDIETHTVESHIYSLRQKIGEDAAEFLITNTSDGYILFVDE